MRVPPPLSVAPSDAAVLRAWSADAGVGPAAARRAEIVLLSGTGLGPTAVAERLGCSKQTVITWRERYRTAGVDGLRDAPRSGRPATVDPLAVVRRTLQDPGTGRWSSRTLAADLGISNVAVANVWRSWGIVPAAGGAVRAATQPPVDRPVSGLLGVFTDPSVRLLAVTVGDVPPLRPGHVPPTPPAGLEVLDRGARPAGDPTALVDFLAGLDPRSAPVLVAEPPSGDLPAALRGWAAAHPHAALHTTVPDASWSRLVQVACLVATATPAGEVAVRSLRTALTSHDGGGHVSWTAPSGGVG